MKYYSILLLLMVLSCQSAEDHGHEHDESGGHETVDTGVPLVKNTTWSEQLELYVQYPAMVSGKISRFATHLTVLKGHLPVKDGELTVSLVKDGKGIRHTVSISENEGLFNPALQPKEAGLYQLIFDYNSTDIKERFVLEGIEVFDSSEKASQVQVEESGSEIEFTKEQAWGIDFQTERAKNGEVYEVIHTSGTWLEAPGTTNSISAKTSGIVDFEIDHLTEGTLLNQGQLIMTIRSGDLTVNNLRNDIEMARAAYEQAKSEYERNQQLHESNIVSKADLERIENRYRITKSSYETLIAGYSAGGKQVIAPFSGFVKEVTIENGNFVEEGMPLITLGNLKSRLLEIQVGPSYASELESIHNIWYESGPGKWSNMVDSGGEVRSIARKVDREDPMISVFAQINEEISFPEGSFTEVQIAFGNMKEALIIPESALLEDYGSYSAIVQISGETFERRPIVIGKRNGVSVEVLRGIKVGEYVVSRSAYQVKMASLKGQTPAHGHTH